MTRIPAAPFGGPAVVGSFVASAGIPAASRRAARTRGFAAPAFAGCAFIEGERALVKARYKGCQARVLRRYGSVLTSAPVFGGVRSGTKLPIRTKALVSWKKSQ